MADRVEEVMQAMVPELDDLKRKKIFDESEVRHIVRRRRDFEYLFQKPTARPQDYLSCIRYEVALETLRKRRSKALNWRRKTISDVAGIRRMHHVFDRSTKRFKGNLRLWYQYIDFCLRSGSTQILNRVLLRCVKLHPRETNLWLLAADRALKMGQVKAARTLLLRGLRFLPRSAKLWGQFLRLEVQVARNVQLNGGGAAPSKAEDAKASADTPGDAAASAKTAATALGPWAPACLLLRKAVARLKGNTEACAAFLSSVKRALEAVRAECTVAADNEEMPTAEVLAARAGFQRLCQDLSQAITELRPDASAQDVPPNAVRTLWQLWWDQERESGQSWKTICGAVAAEAPPVAVQHVAMCLASDHVGDEVPGALVDLAGAPRSAVDGETALAVLEALETWAEESVRAGHSSDKIKSMEDAALALIRRATESHPGCLRLRLIACQRLPAGERPLTAGDAAALRASSGHAGVGLDGESAAQLLAVTVANSDLAAEAVDRQLATLFRALAAGASPQPLLQVFLAESMSTGSLTDFRNACDRAVTMVRAHWESPALRVEALAGLLDLELRVLTLSELGSGRICDRFEELLTSMDDRVDAKVEWWVRYVQFVHRASQLGGKAEGVRGVPTMMDLHWRAMRSVANQALYLERVHGLLQSGTAPAIDISNP